MHSLVWLSAVIVRMVVHLSFLLTLSIHSTFFLHLLQLVVESLNCLLYVVALYRLIDVMALCSMIDFII